MIIDFHTHVFPDKIAQSTISALQSNSGTTPNTNGTVQGMLDAMARANSDICVTLPVLTKASQFDSDGTNMSPSPQRRRTPTVEQWYCASGRGILQQSPRPYPK